MMHKSALFVSIILTGSATTAFAQGEASIGPLQGQPFVRMTGDILGYELIPNANARYKRAPFRTNRWGMRDRDYSKVPAPGTFRLALLGSSFTMGAGVAEEQTLEWLLEDRLNREKPGSSLRFEILNFSVGGYGVLQNVAVMEQKVFAFSPDAILLIVHDNERIRVLRHLTELIRAGVPVEAPYLRSKIEEAGVNGRMQEPEILRRLERVADDMLMGSYRRAVESSRKKSVRLVGLAFPIPSKGGQSTLAIVSRMASEAGIPMLSLEGVYDGIPLDSVRRSERDMHLNARGHRLVANRLYEVLRDNDPQALRLGFARRP